MQRTRLVQSVGNACRGIRFVFVRERNFRIECFFSLLTIAATVFFGVGGLRFWLICFLLVFALILEMINSGIEALIDMVKPRLHEQARLIKDIFAGAVLCGALASYGFIIVLLLPFVVEFVSLM